jgi:hypothetical protein
VIYSERLNLSQEGEKWIVNWIRETRMGTVAKIDLGKVRFFLFNSLSVLALMSSRETHQLAVRAQVLGVAMARSCQRGASSSAETDQQLAQEVTTN